MSFFGFQKRLSDSAHSRIKFITGIIKKDNPFLHVEKRSGEIHVCNDFGGYVNRFDFYSEPSTGGIGSLAIYGENITGYFNQLATTKKFFGLDIEEIFIDDGGIQDYLNIDFTYESSCKDKDTE